MSRLFAAGFVALAAAARADLAIQDLGTITPDDLAGAIVGLGVTVSNVTYQGRSWAAGEFFGGAGIIGFDSGIVLSTGNVTQLPLPNSPPPNKISNRNGMPGDPDLDAIAGVPTADAAVLEFDFVPSTSVLSVSFVFSSEEYNEYVGSNANDVFAFILDGQNIALVPGTSEPVSVNTVNQVSHAADYINNELAPYPLNFPMDGATTVYTVSQIVTPGVSHHMKLAIADGGDDRLDSNVFIKAGSFSSIKAGISVVKTAPRFVPPGQVIPFTITVANIGDVSALDVIAWDSVPAGTTLASLPAPGVLTGNIMSWAFGDLAPGTSASVTFTTSVNGGVGAVVNQSGGCPRGGFTGSNGVCLPWMSVFSEPAASDVLRPVACVGLSVSPSGGVCSATVLAYELDWSNCGEQTGSNLTITDSLPSGAAYVAGSFVFSAGGAPAGIPALVSTAYQAVPGGPWIDGDAPNGASAPGSLRWVVDQVVPGETGTIRFTSVVDTPPPPMGVVSVASATILGDGGVASFSAVNSTAPDLRGSPAISATRIEVGMPFLVTLTVTNVGCSTALGLMPACTGSGASLFVGAPSPPSVASLAQGEAATFEWTVSATAPGIFNIDFTVTGTDGTSGSGMGWGPWSLIRRPVVQGPLLASGLTASPATVCPGGTHWVVLTVSNAGWAATAELSPTPLRVSAGSGVVQAGPWPAPPVALPGGGRVCFTWTVAGGGVGPLVWSVTLGGMDTYLNTALPPVGLGTTVTVGSPAALAAALSAPPIARRGRWITLALTVTETGGGPVTQLVPAGPAPASLGTVVAGPAPAGPLARPAGGTTTFVWTFSVTGSGVLNFSATAAGDACSSLALAAGAAASTTVPAPPSLTAGLAVSASVVVTGQPVTVVLTVSNAGGTDVVALGPVLARTGPSASVLTGPVPASATVAAGGSASFTWTVSPTARGSLVLTAAGSGADADIGAVVGSPSVSATLAVLAPASLTAGGLTLAPAAAPVGAILTATLLVHNGGDLGAVVNVPAPGLWCVPAGSAGPSSPPTPSTTGWLAGGADASFTWSVGTSSCGTVQATATVTGAEGGTGRALGPVVAVSASVSVFASAATITLGADHDHGPSGSQITLIATVRDACGIPDPGLTVNFSAPHGGDTVLAGSAVTDANGQARVTLRLGVDIGPHLVEAWLPATLLSATSWVTTDLPPDALTSTGAALDRNVFQPRQGETLLVRLYPATADPVVVRVYSGSGRLIRTLTTLEPVGGGRYVVRWDGLTEDGYATAAGVCLVSVTGGGIKATLKLVLR